MARGKLIVFYGINNLGKTTQAKLLVEKIKSVGKKAEYLKYLIYDLEPSGSMINEYLRAGNPYKLSPREFQLLAAVNFYHYQPKLQTQLESGINIVAEDYWATGIAWGEGDGVDRNFLIKIRQGIIKEDIAFLFDGQRFLNSREQGHTFEQNDDLTEKVRQIHLRLGEELGWIKINANQSIENIHNEIWERVKSIL